MRNNFTLPEDLAFPNILSSGSDEFAVNSETKEQGPQAYGEQKPFAYFYANLKDDTLEWEEILPWLKAHAGDMQVWLKGGKFYRTYS